MRTPLTCFGLAFAGITLIPVYAPGQTASTTPAATPAAAPAAATGSAPIETTLFAYRALRADAKAVSDAIISATGSGDSIVIGTPADLGAFAQWRAAIGQAQLLTNRAKAIHKELRPVLTYTWAPPLPALSISIDQDKKEFTQGDTGTYKLTVSNSPAASVTVGEVQVTASLPAGLTLGAGGMHGGASWNCAANICRRSDPLSPGAVYPPIFVDVNVTNLHQPKYTVTFTATVAGGGSASNSATQTTTINPGPVTVAGGGRGPAPRAELVQGVGAGGAIASPVQIIVNPAAPAASSSSSSGGFSTALTAIPAFIQLAQFLSTAFAVNQTLTGSQNSLTDAALINAVSQQLGSTGRAVFVPSVYNPQLFAGADVHSLFLWKALTELETARIQLFQDIGVTNKFLLQANFVTQNPTKYSAKSLNDALAYSGQAQSLTLSAQSIAANIDAFEASLWGGTVVTAAPAASPAASSAASSPAASSPASSASGAAQGATGASGAAGSTGAAAATTPAPAAGSSAPSNVTLAQLVGSDLLAQTIGLTWPPTDQQLNNVDFLNLHALEAGGSQLNKTNIFYGTHIFFSGGAVSTFSLYKAMGKLTCSGFAYNYRGNVREKNFESAVLDPTPETAVLSSDLGCLAPPAGTSTTAKPKKK